MAMDSDTTPMISEDTRSQEDLQLSNHLDDINQDEMSTGSEGVTKGVCGRVINVLKFVTVEPLMLLYITGFTVQSSITTNLLLVKVLVTFIMISWMNVAQDMLKCANRDPDFLKTFVAG